MKGAIGNERLHQIKLSEVLCITLLIMPPFLAHCVKEQMPEFKLPFENPPLKQSFQGEVIKATLLNLKQ